MPKIKVFTKLTNKLDHEVLENTYQGFLNDDKIVYKEDHIIVTIYKDYNTIRMIRRNQNQVTELLFEKGKTKIGKCNFEKYTLEMIVDTSALEIEKENIHICYQTKIEEEIIGNFEFKLQYEVIK